MIFIFIAALLVRNMDGLTSTRNFLSTPKVNQTMAVERETYEEVYLLVSILCYNSFSALGVMILPWTLISELYPIQVTNNILTTLCDWKISSVFVVAGERKNGWLHSYSRLHFDVQFGENFPIPTQLVLNGGHVLFIRPKQLGVLHFHLQFST